MKISDFLKLKVGKHLTQSSKSSQRNPLDTGAYISINPCQSIPNKKQTPQIHLHCFWLKQKASKYITLAYSDLIVSNDPQYPIRAMKKTLVYTTQFCGDYET